jgi:hypothetical protein
MEDEGKIEKKRQLSARREREDEGRTEEKGQ